MSSVLGNGPQAVAESMIDEVALLEAALREAMLKKRSTPTPRGTPLRNGEATFTKEYSEVTSKVESRHRFDNDFVAYSVQLKSWIDMQVDTRLSQILSGELALVQQDCATAMGTAQRVDAELEVLKNTQAKLLAVVEGISEELSRTKQSVEWATKGGLEDFRRELKRWTEDSQAALAEDLLARNQKLVSDLRSETTAAFRSEAAAVAALDEQLWLSEQRLSQRIDAIALPPRENMTIIERKIGEPDQIVQQRSTMEDVKEENTVHIRPPPPILGAPGVLEQDRDQAVFVERAVRSPRGVLRFEEQTQPTRVRVRYGAAASDVPGLRLSREP